MNDINLSLGEKVFVALCAALAVAVIEHYGCAYLKAQKAAMLPAPVSA
jgi:hypothetical protein